MAWHVLASTRVSNRRKVVLFEERRLLTMVSVILRCGFCTANHIYRISFIRYNTECLKGAVGFSYFPGRSRKV